MAETERKRKLPDPTLADHVIQLASQVAVALGEVENPMTKKAEVDLDVARYLIDMIAVLEEKTAGNRTGEEDELFRAALADARMRYVRKSS